MVPMVKVRPGGRIQLDNGSKKKKEAKVATRRIEELQERAIDLDSERKEEVRRNQLLEERNKQLEGELERMMGFLRTKHSEVEAANQKLRAEMASENQEFRMEMETENQKLHSKLQRRDQKISTQADELRKKHDKIVDLEKENMKLKTMNAKFDSVNTLLTRDIADINEERGVLKDVVTDLREREKQLRDENKELSDERIIWKHDEKLLTARLREERQRVDLLSDDIKRLKLENERLSDHVGVLRADLLEERGLQSGGCRRREEVPRSRYAQVG